MNANTKKRFYYSSLILIIWAITTATSYSQNSDSLKTSTKPNCYSESETEGFLKLIAEGIEYKNKLSTEKRKTKALDSLITQSLKTIESQSYNIKSLRIDSLVNSKERQMYMNFQNDFIKPFVKDLIISTSKNERKNGFITGSLAAVTAFSLIIISLKLF